MAGRPKKTTTETTTTKKVSDENNLELQLKQLQEQLAKLKAENEALKSDAVEAETESEESEEEINGDTEIAVISQTVGTLVLSTEGNGIGTVYRFSEFGEVQDIPFSDLKDIVKNKPRFAKEGAYYITSKEAVNKLRLTKDYENIISESLFNNILDEKSSVIVEAYKNAPKMQQEQIVSMIEDRLSKGKDVDGNVLVKIGKLCGKDFLHELAEEE